MVFGLISWCSLVRIHSSRESRTSNPTQFAMGHFARTLFSVSCVAVVFGSRLCVGVPRPQLEISTEDSLIIVPSTPSTQAPTTTSPTPSTPTTPSSIPSVTPPSTPSATPLADAAPSVTPSSTPSTTPSTTTSTSSTTPTAPSAAEGAPEVDTKLGDPDATSDRPDIYSLHVKSDIRFRWASTKVNSRVANPSSKSQEITFTVVLPEHAFISGFLMEIDGKVYKAYVKEKEEAKKDYEHAVSQGQSAAHVAINPRDTTKFQVSVNVAANEKIRFELAYDELLIRRGGNYEHAITIDPGQVVKDLKVLVSIRESRHITELRVPDIRKDNNLIEQETGKDNELAIIKKISAKEIEISYEPTPEQQKELSAEKGIQGQFVVQYDVERAKDAGDILVVDGYFVHFVAPNQLPPLPKHVAFVVDISGSMAGRRLEQTKEALVKMLEDLRPQDTFGFVTFSDDAIVWNSDSLTPATLPPWPSFGAPVEKYDGADGDAILKSRILRATPANVGKAIQFVKGLEVVGGTNIHDSVLLSLRLASLGPEGSQPLVIFMTDGLPTSGVTSRQQIIRSVTKANQEKQVSLFSIAFGEDADFTLLKKLSLGNFGFARRIYEASDASLQMEGFYREVASPLLSNVTVSYLEDRVDLKSLTKSKFKSLFAGSEIIVAGKVKDKESNETALHPKVSAQGQEGLIILDRTSVHNPGFDLPLPTPPPVERENQTEAQQFVERLWAYLTIRQLLDEVEAQGDESETQPELVSAQPLVPEISRPVTKKETPSERALRLALKYEFVTKLTSLVVVKPNSSESTSDPTERPPQSDFGLGSQSSGPVHLFAPAGLPLATQRPIRPTFLSTTRRFTQTSSTPDRIVGGSSPVEPNVGNSTPLSQTSTTSSETPNSVSSSSSELEFIPLEELDWLNDFKVVNDSSTDPATIDGNIQLQGLLPNNSTVLTIVSKPSNDTYQECVAQLKQETKLSRCKHLKTCILKDLKDLRAFQSLLCVIDDEYVGVCCPQDTP